MALQQSSDDDEIVELRHLECDRCEVAALREVRLLVEHECDAAAHPRREVSSGPADDEHGAAGHVLAAVVADAFDHRDRSGVAHGESLTRDTADERLAAGGAVQRDVADDDVVLARRRRAARGGRMTSLPPERPLPT